MEALRIEDRPALRNPYLILTFAGWSDAAGVATAAGRFLTEHLQAERFASIDSEEFYSFADLRPQARYNDEGQREVIWPANEFFASPQPQLERDLIIGVGVEPHLKWRTFTNLMLSLVQEFDVYQTFTLGALWADVLYSMPIQFSGSATDPQLASRLGLGTGSRYEGPTGMVGVLHDTLRRNRLTSASIWANMPYYVSVTPNPKGILSLARRGMEVIGLATTFPELESEARDFDARVAEAIAQDPKIAEHVRKLERQLGFGRTSSRQATPAPQEEPINGDALADEFQRFLREQRRDPDAQQ